MPRTTRKWQSKGSYPEQEEKGTTITRSAGQDVSLWAPKAAPFRNLNPLYLLSPPTLHLSTWCYWHWAWACAWLSLYPFQGILTLTSGVSVMEGNLTSAVQCNGLGSPAQVVQLLTLPHVQLGELEQVSLFPWHSVSSVRRE